MVSTNSWNRLSSSHPVGYVDKWNRVVKKPALQEPNTPEAVSPVPLEPENVDMSGIRKDAGGFVYADTSGVTLPSADELYNMYKSITGREDEGIRQYLASPQFKQAVQEGTPMWMAADPIWRSLFIRVGRSPDTLSRNHRREAILSRLSTLQT